MILLTLRIDAQRLPQVDFLQPNTTTADRLVTEENKTLRGIRTSPSAVVASLSTDSFLFACSQIVGPILSLSSVLRRIIIF